MTGAPEWLKVQAGQLRYIYDCYIMILAVIIQEEVSKKAEGIFIIATEWLITNEDQKAL